MCLAAAQAATQNSTSEKQTKTKRGLTEQTRTFHNVNDYRPLVLYPELAEAEASQSEAKPVLIQTPAPTVFDTEPPKQVTK